MAQEGRDLANNRQAYHDFSILDTYEAGAVLKGTEVKSILAGRIQLKDSFVTVRGGEVFLCNAHVSHYEHGNRENHDPLRERKLLLNRREISKLEKETSQKGMTLVATRVYLRNGRIKFEVGVAKGKKTYDKRETAMKRTVERETAQQLKERNR